MKPHTRSPVARLPEGPVDVVGDVHGEREALEALLRHLGYDEAGAHPEGRRLAFVGDLTDRGPDSLGVVRRVRSLVEAGRATCVLGNHELNVLRGELKHGNGWALDAPAGARKGVFPHSAAGDEACAFFRTLPLAAANAALRIVHACWDEAAFAQLAALPGEPGLLQAFEDYEQQTQRELVERGWLEAQQREETALGDALHDPQATVGLREAIGRVDAHRQMNNPVRVLVSGVERLGRTPFYSSGKWRFAERVAWWNGYDGAADVVCGHYWRWPVPVAREAVGKGDPDLFEGVPVDAWLGPAKRVFCVDYGVGRRAAERLLNPAAPAANNKLAALRWNGPGVAAGIVFDDGQVRTAVR